MSGGLDLEGPELTGEQHRRRGDVVVPDVVVDGLEIPVHLAGHRVCDLAHLLQSRILKQQDQIDEQGVHLLCVLDHRRYPLCLRLSVEGLESKIHLIEKLPVNFSFI